MGEVDKEILDDSLGDVLNGGFVSRFLRRYPTPILEALLACRTTGRNIIWADNEYECLGTGYAGCDEITVEKITGSAAGTIKPRIAKAAAHQSARTKTRAEVFTPSWLVNRMNNYIDCAWFGRRDVFNVEDFAVCGRDTLRGLRGAVPSDHSTHLQAGTDGIIGEAAVFKDVHPPRHSEQFFAAGEKCEESHTTANDSCAHAQQAPTRVPCSFILSEFNFFDCFPLFKRVLTC